MKKEGVFKVELNRIQSKSQGPFDAGATLSLQFHRF